MDIRKLNYHSPIYLPPSAVRRNHTNVGGSRIVLPHIAPSLIMTSHYF